jgi:hypothetical protein
MSHSTHATSAFAAALALCAVSIPSEAAIGDAGAPKPAVAHASDSGRIILAAQRGGGGGARAGGGAARAEGGGARAGGGAVNRESAASNRQLRSSATSSVNHNRQASTNVNRNLNANINRDVNVNNVNINRDVNVNVRRDYYDGWDDRWHPVAAAAAVTATAAIVGSMVRTLPPSCSTVVVNGVSYSQCGSTWYQPQYAGTSVQYVVVNPPR